MTPGNGHANAGPDPVAAMIARVSSAVVRVISLRPLRLEAGAALGVGKSGVDIAGTGRE
jgi:hypothetical protein